MIEKHFSIMGIFDNSDRPNVEIIYYSKDKDEAKKVYKKLLRLDELQNSDDEKERQEFNELCEELQNEDGVGLFTEAEWIDGMPIEFDINGLYECIKLK